MKIRASDKFSTSPKEPTVWETFNKAIKARSSWPDKVRTEKNVTVTGCIMRLQGITS